MPDQFEDFRSTNPTVLFPGPFRDHSLFLAGVLMGWSDDDPKVPLPDPLSMPISFAPKAHTRYD